MRPYMLIDKLGRKRIVSSTRFTRGRAFMRKVRVKNKDMGK